MFVELTEDNLMQTVSEGGTVVVQYTAGWCGNCRVMKPKFKRFAADSENATFIIVDAEKFPESRKLADVSNLPTFAQTNKVENLKELIDEVTAN
jgi:thiol-disulfide isomerase/thioredoxin